MTAPAPSIDIRKTKTIRLRHAPAWLPKKYRNRTERLRISFKPTYGERRFLKKPKVMPLPSEWAPKNRVVTYGPLKGSKWDNSFMPHMRGIMDASFYPSVRIIGNVKAPQTGSSAGNETMLGYIGDVRPGDAFVVYPDRDTASKRSTDYLQTMFTQSPRLKRLLTGFQDDLASLRIKLLPMLIYMGWSGSTTSLGNISARFLFGDELDKWKEQPSKKEASSLDLFLERFRAFKYGAKCWLTSTPSVPTGAISQYMENEAEVVFDYWPQCPDCGTHHLMSFDNIKVDGGERDPQKIKKEKLAYYVCTGCGVQWNDRARDKAIQNGIWYSRPKEVAPGQEQTEKPLELFEYLKKHNPENICFHSPAWISPLVSLSECLARWFKGLKSKRAMHYFDTQIKAQAYVDYETQRQEDTILALADNRPSGLVPGKGKVAALVAGADTQDDGFYYIIRAVGWGLQPERWRVRAGFVKTFDDLAQVLFKDHYKDSDGLYYPVHLCVQDAMGHRTSEVYDFSRHYPGRLLPYKGGKGRLATPNKITTIDTWPGTNKLIPGGVRLVTCDTHYYKDELATMLRVNPDDPGAYHMDKDITLEQAQQLCAEYVDERGLWQCPKSKPNHYWDCEMMAGISEDILQIKYWQKESE